MVDLSRRGFMIGAATVLAASSIPFVEVSAPAKQLAQAPAIPHEFHDWDIVGRLVEWCERADGTWENVVVQMRTHPLTSRLSDLAVVRIITDKRIPPGTTVDLGRIILGLDEIRSIEDLRDERPDLLEIK
jgi:hypothetical protein